VKSGKRSHLGADHPETDVEVAVAGKIPGSAKQVMINPKRNYSDG
jgi:hypothetical protein